MTAPIFYDIVKLKERFSHREHRGIETLPQRPQRAQRKTNFDYSKESR